MAIDKSIRQYYSRGQLVKPGPGRPGYQGWSPGVSHSGAPSGAPSGGGGGDGRGRELAAQRAAAQQAAAAAAQRATTQRAMQDKIAAAEKQQAITQQAKKQSTAEEVLQYVKDPSGKSKWIGEGVTEASLNRLLAKDPLLEKYDLAKNINLIKGYADDPTTQKMSFGDQLSEQIENQGLYGYTWPGKPEVYVRDLEKFAPTPDILNPNAMKIEDRNRQIASTISHEFRHNLLDEKTGADIKKRIDLMGLEGPIKVGLSDHDKEEIFNRVLDLKSGAGEEQDLRDREYIKSVLGYDIGDRLDPLAEEFISRTTQPYQDRIMREGIKSIAPVGTGEGLGSIDVGFQGDETFKPEGTTLPSRNIHKDPEETIQEMIARQQEEKYGPTADPTKFGETIDKRTSLLPTAPVTTGQGKIAGPVQGLIDQPRPPVTGDRIMDLAQRQRRADLSRIALQTDKSLTDVSDPKRGIMSNLMDTGKRYAKSAAPYMALNTLGLGAFNLPLGIAKAFGFDPVGSLMAKFPKGTGTKTAFQPSEGGGDGRVQEQVLEQAPANVIEASIQKFTPDQMNMIKRKHSQLQEVIDSGTYQGRQLTAEEIQMLQEKSLEIQKLIEQYLVNPEELGLARGGIAGLRG